MRERRTEIRRSRGRMRDQTCTPETERRNGSERGSRLTTPSTTVACKTSTQTHIYTLLNVLSLEGVRVVTNARISRTTLLSCHMYSSSISRKDKERNVCHSTAVPGVLAPCCGESILQSTFNPKGRDDDAGKPSPIATELGTSSIG